MDDCITLIYTIIYCNHYSNGNREQNPEETYYYENPATYKVECVASLKCLFLPHQIVVITGLMLVELLLAFNFMNI